MPQKAKKQLHHASCHAESPNLPRPLRSAVASVLLSLYHSGRLYGAKDIANTVNDAAGALYDPAISTGATVTMLLRPFANDAANEFRLQYDEFCCKSGDTHVLYIWRRVKEGQHGGSRSAIFFGQFSSVKAGSCVEVI